MGTTAENRRDTDQWGVIPAPILTVLHRLQQRAVSALAGLDTAPADTHAAADHASALLGISASVEVADRATRDYRNLFNAYTHRFHSPKPPISALAAAQGLVIQSFAKRYTAKTIAAIENLLSTDPDVDAILGGLPSFEDADLWSVTDALDLKLHDRAQHHNAAHHAADQPGRDKSGGA